MEDNDEDNHHNPSSSDEQFSKGRAHKIIRTYTPLAAKHLHRRHFKSYISCTITNSERLKHRLYFHQDVDTQHCTFISIQGLITTLCRKPLSLRRNLIYISNHIKCDLNINILKKEIPGRTKHIPLEGDHIFLRECP